MLNSQNEIITAQKFAIFVLKRMIARLNTANELLHIKTKIMPTTKIIAIWNAILLWTFFNFASWWVGQTKNHSFRNIEWWTVRNDVLLFKLQNRNIWKKKMINNKHKIKQNNKKLTSVQNLQRNLFHGSTQRNNATGTLEKKNY